MKITRQEIVVSFEIDPAIVLSCGAAIKSIQKKFGGQILNINAPDAAPPSMPRIILRLEDTIMNLGLDRIQITVIPPSHVADDIEKASKFSLQRTSSFLSEMLPAIPKYAWSGVVSEIDFEEDPLTSTSGNQAATPIFDKIININRKGRDLSAFQLQYGIRDEDYYVTYTVSAFEGRKIEIKDPPKDSYLVIEASDYPLSSCGIRVLLDINNKPTKHHENPVKDIEAILARKNILAFNLVDDLNLEGVLQ